MDCWLEKIGMRVINYSCGTRLLELPELDCFNPNTKYGFCYDESNDDYKVFAIAPANPDYDVQDSCRAPQDYKAYVYSLKCDCWRMIGDFPCMLASYKTYSSRGFDNGGFANGSIYWTVTPEKRKKIIMSLDIKTETWQEVLLPDFGDGVHAWTSGIFGESLYVLCQFADTCADLWIMKECGAKTLWTKLFTVPYIDELITRNSYLKPICISRNGDIMLNLSSGIVLYNPMEKTCKDLLADQIFEELKVYPYGESLVSPHLENSQRGPTKVNVMVEFLSLLKR